MFLKISMIILTNQLYNPTTKGKESLLNAK